MTGTVQAGGPNGPLAAGGITAPVPVRTSACTASPGDFVPCDTTSGSLTVTLPAAPADGAVVAVKMIRQSGSNTVTVAAQGGDTVNKVAGSASLTLSLLNQGVTLQYQAQPRIWYVIGDDVPLGGLDGRYVQSVTAADTSIVVGGTASAPTVRTGTLDVVASQHPPAAAVGLNNQKITSLANGSASSDAAAFGQIPVSLPPSGAASGDLSGTYPSPGVAKVAGTPVTPGATAPSSPATNDLWYDSTDDLWRRWNGSGWQVSGTPSARGYRPPDIQVADKVWMGQASNPFTFSGSGATGSNADTSDFVIGVEACFVTTNGAGANTKISGTVNLNMTGKSLVVWVKMVNYGHFLGGYPRLYLGDSGLTNGWYWKLTESAGQPWALDGEWLRITLPWGAATLVGLPSRSSLAVLTIQLFDDSTQAVTIHLGGVATMAEPAAPFPNGVLSLCFDDGYISQFQTAKPYLDKYGFRCTAYLITETLWNHSAYPGYLDLPSAQALEGYSGWEIAAHAYTAANHNAGYVSIGDAASLADMQAAKAYLRSQGFRAPDSFAYPLGVFDAGTVANAQALFNSGRTISQLGGFPDETFPPAQLSRLRSMAVSANSGIVNPEAYVTAAAANREWLLLTMHDIQSSASGNLQLSTANFQALMDYIAASGIAVLPVSEVLRAGMTPQVDTVAADYTVIGSAVSAGSTGKPADAGHVHADQGPGARPADMGLIAWNMDWALVSATNNITPGTVYLHAIWLRSQQLISNLVWDLATVTAWTCTSGQCFMALFDSGGTERGITADQSSNWNSPGYKNPALTSPYLAPAGKYYIAILMNGSGTTFTARGGSGIPTFANAGLSGAALRFAVNGTLATSMPSPITVASNTNTNALPTAVGVS